MPVEQTFTVRQVADLAVLSERTVRAMISDGRLPVVRLVGVRAVRIPADAVRALLQGDSGE